LFSWFLFLLLVLPLLSSSSFDLFLFFL